MTAPFCSAILQQMNEDQILEQLIKFSPEIMDLKETDPQIISLAAFGSQPSGHYHQWIPGRIRRGLMTEQWN